MTNPLVRLKVLSPLNFHGMIDVIVECFIYIFFSTDSPLYIETVGDNMNWQFSRYIIHASDIYIYINIEV